MNKADGVLLRLRSCQRGYSLIEFAITMGLVALVAGGVFAAYKFRVAPAAWTSAKFDIFNSVLAAAQTAQAARGNAYPAQASAAALTSSALAAYVGSTSTDISNWTYQCSGSNLTLVVVVPDAPSGDSVSMLKDRISYSVPNSTVTNSANSVTVAISPVNCQ
ncbi:MAG: prepilin-type N-terminal cleavage/methylation domain-containing protein [Nitrospirae bacterium]|nr:prepilin-type N-terminal cleavage/methylation domain-containing protein [Nitrospirota bacterium]